MQDDDRANGSPEAIPSRDANARTEAVPIRRSLLIALAAVLVLAIAFWAYHFSRPALPPVLPEDMSKLEPMLRDYIAEQAEWVSRDQRDGKRHATLGLIYAANGLWNEARKSFANASQLLPREPLAALYEAVAMQELGDGEGALESMRQLANRFPEFPQGHYRLGEALMRGGQTEEAGTAFARLIELAPQEWRGFAGLGEVRLRSGNLEEAADLLEQALRVDPSAKPAHHLLGQAYERLGRTNAAQRELRLGRDAQHYPMPDAWAQQAPKHMKRLPDLLAMSREYLMIGRPRWAVSVLEPALPYHPDNPTVLNNLAIAYTGSGLPQKAEELLARALTIAPDYLPAYIALASAQLANNAPAAALTNALKAIELAPTNVQPYLVQANALLSLERDTNAIEALRQASERDPKNPQILMDIGDIYLLNLGQTNTAIATYDQAIQLNSAFFPGHIRLTEVYLALGRTNEARASLEQCARLAPAEPIVQALRERLEPVRSPNAPAATDGTTDL